jgi:hypothetical protein
VRFGYVSGIGRTGSGTVRGWHDGELYLAAASLMSRHRFRLLDDVAFDFERDSYGQLTVTAIAPSSSPGGMPPIVLDDPDR